MSAEQWWGVAVAVFTIVVGLAGLASYRIAVLERKVRIQRDQTEEARALEEEARALESAGAIRLTERRADTVLRALRASSLIASTAGTLTYKARRPAAVILGITPTLEPLQDAVTEVSLALDEIRLLGPASVAEAMGAYFDAVMDVHEAVTSGQPDAQQTVRSRGEAMYEAKVVLVAAAREAGIGDPE